MQEEGWRRLPSVALMFFLLVSLCIALKQCFLILCPLDDLSKSVWQYQKDEEVFLVNMILLLSIL
jgi:hypothetical protein